jgi:hypothetical protein
MRYDHAERKRGKRTGRMRGCMVYIPAEELIRAGISPDDPPPAYTLRGVPGKRVSVKLYPAEK